MRNNEFENRVERKLEELKFTPSAAVWQKIEIQIREQKRKKRFLYWLLPAAILCISIAGWFIYTSEKNSYKNTALTVENKKINPAAAKNNAQKEMNHFHEKKDVVTKKKNQPINKNADQNNLIHLSAIKTKAGLPVSSAVISNKKNKTINQSEQQKTKTEKTGTPVPYNLTIVSTQPVVVIDPDITNKKDTASISLKQNEQIETKETALTDSSSSVKVQMPVLIKDSTANKKKKMELAFVLRTGIATMSYFTAGRNSANRLYSSSRSSTTGSDAGFIGGIQFKKVITKRSAFSFGLDYAYYSSSNKTGATVYSAAQFSNNVTTTNVNSYTRDGNSTTHKNNYHFIEVPVLYHMLLNKIEKRPISFNTGIAYAYLISSNAQYYYRATGAYYYDQKLFSRSQLQLQSGISIGLIRKLHYPLQMELHYQYNVSGFWKQTLDLNQHLSFKGIQFTWRMKK